MVGQRGGLPDLSPFLPGFQWRRHRRHPRNHFKTGLHQGSRMQRDLAQSLFRLAIQRRRLRRARLQKGGITLRHQRRSHCVVRRRPPARHARDPRSRARPHQRGTRVVPPQLQGRTKQLFRPLHLDRLMDLRWRRTAIHRRRIAPQRYLHLELLQMPAGAQLRFRAPRT
jgi:hypothetical protein